MKRLNASDELEYHIRSEAVRTRIYREYFLPPVFDESILHQTVYPLEGRRQA